MIVLPLRHQFKKVFEKDDMLCDMILHMNSLQKNEKFVNIIQGPLWKKKCELYPEKLLIPYFLYCDDLEINNPLGSHSSTHSICNFYYSFPCLPGDTKLNNIFLAAVIKSQDLKKHGNEKCLKYLINEIIFLEEYGIEIVTSKGIYKVHFIVALIIGDNLALNLMLGFSKSFNGLFCRFCKINKNSSQKAAIEIPDLMKNHENYEVDVKKQNSHMTGIVDECVFNRVPSFHVTDNFAVDAMHDIFEGICHYDLCSIILYFIQKKKIISH